MASRLVRVNPVTVNDVLEGHVQLGIDCLDRVYLHGYLAQLQVGGQVVQFLRRRGFPVPSPACLQQIGDGFRRAVASFADANHIPVVRLKSTDRNIDVMQRYLSAAARTGRSQVAAIAVAQEPQRVFISRQRDTDPSKPPQFSFDKKDRRVTVFYFYLWDADFGPAFIKVCTYCPWPIKVWVNGHEWVKRQATQAGLGFTELSNGFAACADPDALQAICNRLQSGTIEVFFQRWLARLPLPLTPADGDAGYWWELSMARSRSPARWCSTPHDMRAVSSRPWSPTTSTWAARTPSRSCSTARSAAANAPPAASSRPRSSPAAPRSPSTPSTSTPASSGI
jgi:hypothetical protein